MKRRGTYHKRSYTTENVCLEVRIVKARSEDELIEKVDELLSSDSRWSIAGPLRTTDLGYGNKFSYSIKLEKTETITHDHSAEFDEYWENFMAKFY